MKKLIVILLNLFTIFSVLSMLIFMTACGTSEPANYANNKTISDVSVTRAAPTVEPTPESTPVPEGYLSFAQAQAQEGFFVKHGDWYIDVLKYNGDSCTEDFVIFPRKSSVDQNSVNENMLQFTIDEDKIVYFSRSSNMPRLEIAPASFYGYALPFDFSYRDEGEYYPHNGNFGTGVADKINGVPITDDMFTSGPSGFYVAEHGVEVTISGYEGTRYIEETACAVSACYEIRNQTVEGKTLVVNGSKKFPVKERVLLETSLQPTVEGYSEVVFAEPLTGGMYVMRNSENDVNTLIEVIE